MAVGCVVISGPPRRLHFKQRLGFRKYLRINDRQMLAVVDQIAMPHLANIDRV